MTLLRQIGWRKYLLVLLILLLALLTSFNSTAKAYGASGTCYFGGGNCSVTDPVRVGYNDVFSGRTADNPIFVLGNVNTKQQFVDFVMDRYLNPKGQQDKIGAAFYISEVLQATHQKTRNPDSAMLFAFEARIMQQNVSFTIEDRDINTTTFFDGNNNIFYDHSVPTVSRSVIVIRQNGQLMAVIERTCGNASIFGVINPSDLTLNPKMSGPTSAIPGQNLTYQASREILNYQAAYGNLGNATYTVERKKDNVVQWSSGSQTFPVNAGGAANLGTPYSYTTVASDADSIICYVMTITGKPNPPNPTIIIGPPASSCTPVSATGTIATNIWTESAAQGGSDYTVEPEQANSSGRLWNSISNTPQLNRGEWGYKVQANQGIPTKVKESEDGKTAFFTATRPASFTYGATAGGGQCTVWIPAGVWNICTAWAPITYSCPNGDSLVDPTTCRHNYTEYYWVCPDDWGDRGWSVDPPACRSKYSTAPCQDGNLYEYWNTANSARSCPDTWVCPYANTPLFVNEDNGNAPQCEYRCDNVNGLSVAPLSQPGSRWGKNNRPIYNSGDLNCYKPWQVTLTCNYSYDANWYSRDPANGIPGSVPVIINAGDNPDLGNICSKNVTFYGGYVGERACVRISTTISAFETNNGSYLSPNQPIHNGLNWGTRTNPATAEQCYQTIARPYVSFKKTDVRSTTSNINVQGNWSGSTGYGSSVDYAAFASTWIDGLRSYAVNGSVASPKTRTFANDNGVWGGNFGNYNVSPFSHYASTIGAGKPCIGVPGSFTASVVINCNGGTVTISSNVDTNWSYASPKSLYIIADTINISGNVSTLNGVALIAKTVNTCYDDTNNCATPLSIKGLINSDNVIYKRAANQGGGSTVYCSRPSRPTDLPGFVSHTCDRYFGAGETITYSPEFEISPAPYTPSNGLTSGKYDSIRSLPPVY